MWEIVEGESRATFPLKRAQLYLRCWVRVLGFVRLLHFFRSDKLPVSKRVILGQKKNPLAINGFL